MQIVFFHSKDLHGSVNTARADILFQSAPPSVQIHNTNNLQKNAQLSRVWVKIAESRSGVLLYTLTGHLAGAGLNPFAIRTVLIISGIVVDVIKVLEILFRDFGPCWYDSLSLSLESLVNLSCMSLDCRRKPEHKGNTPAIQEVQTHNLWGILLFLHHRIHSMNDSRVSFFFMGNFMTQFVLIWRKRWEAPHYELVFTTDWTRELFFYYRQEWTAEGATLQLLTNCCLPLSRSCRLQLYLSPPVPTIHPARLQDAWKSDNGARRFLRWHWDRHKCGK